MERFWSKVEKTDWCWNWKAGKGSDGYGIFWDIPNKTSRRAPRVAWELENGPIPEGMWILHHCDNPACVNPSHLYIGTAADNNGDAIRRGRNPPIPQKLTAEQVIEIRALPYQPQGKIAAMYGVSQVTISKILRRKSWKHIP